jgi:glutathione S-transferase
LITLYHCMDARSFRPLWMLEELGLPYELKMLPFPPRVHAKAYLAKNPLGTIPLLLDGETRMTESSAICEYLATRYGPTPLAVAPDDPAFGSYLNWLYLGEATLTFPQTIVLRYSQFEPEGRRLPQAVADYARWFLGRLRAVDAALGNGDYLCAERFTAADISVGYACLLAEILGFESRFSPAIRDYLQRITARDAFQRARAAQQVGAAQLPDLGAQSRAIDMELVLKS